MHKLIIILLLMAGTLFAEVTRIIPDKAFFDRDIKIIDIRTEGEWKETGIIEGSYPLTYFNPMGLFSTDEFFAELNKIIEPGETFAYTCRSGGRSGRIEATLEKAGYNAINLDGGIRHIRDNLKLPLVPYAN